MFVRYVGQLHGVPCYVLQRRWRDALAARAFVFGRRIVFGSMADFRNAKVRAHELEHIRQRDVIGPLFPLVYGVCDVVFGYDRNPFEIRARQAAQRRT